ncbi:MAG: DUF2383 domain-containing protein [Rhodospirillaceae bacterium]|nr:DUF2383 domain-containing protein [Rhodospirillales bacterium]
MTMRPEAAITLDELTELANDSAEAYVQAADYASGDLRDMFRLLAGQRRHMAEALADQVRLLGHPARERDTPSGAAHRLMARLKSSFVGDRPRALIEECERADTTLAHRLITVDERLLPPQAVTLIRAFLAEAVAALGQLAAARVRLRGR